MRALAVAIAVAGCCAARTQEPVDPAAAVHSPSRRHDATVARIVAPAAARPRLSGPAAWRVDPQTSWSGQRLRRVVVSCDGRLVRRSRGVVGAPATPTPHTLAATHERNRQSRPGGFLGPWVLSLTVLSNVLYDYGGGPGRIAIHGRGGRSLRDPLGSARSRGCVRVPNRDIVWLARTFPSGTPVRLRG